MKSIALALLVTFTGCNKSEGIVYGAQKSLPSLTQAVQCVEVTQKQAVGMSQFLYSMAKTVASHGGREAVESVVGEKVRHQATTSIQKLYDYSGSKSKCWSLTKSEAGAFLEATGAMAKYIKKNNIIDQMVALMVAVAGGPEAADVAMDSALKVQTTLMKYVGVTPPNENEDTL